MVLTLAVLALGRAQDAHRNSCEQTPDCVAAASDTERHLVERIQDLRKQPPGRFAVARRTVRRAPLGAFVLQPRSLSSPATVPPDREARLA